MLKALSRYGKQLARVVSGEAFSPVPKPLVLFQFDNAQQLHDNWHVHTDNYFGGRSTATLELSASDQCAVFSGHCTVDQSEDADMKRAGYCTASSKVWSWGDYYSLERYSHLVYCVRGDGRTYIANLRTETLADGRGDVWQAAFKTRPGQWLDVHIPFSSFMLTVAGQCTARRMLLPKDRVISVGVAVSAMETAQPPAFDIMTLSSSSGSSSSSGRTTTSSSSSSGTSSSGPGAGPGSHASSKSGGGGGGREGLQHASTSPAGFDFRLELRQVRAERSVDSASEMY